MSDFRLETLEPSYEGDGSILDDKISFLEHVSDLQPQAVPVSIPPKVEPYDINEIEAQLTSLGQQKSQLEKELECVNQLLDLNQKRKLRHPTNTDLPYPPQKRRRLEAQPYFAKDEKPYRSNFLKEPISYHGTCLDLDNRFPPKIEPDDQSYLPPYAKTLCGYEQIAYGLPPKARFPLNTGGKRNGMIIRCRLFCAHCGNYFYAKPTARKSFFVLNHQCSGDKRKQYVIGKHHRKCIHNHSPTPCIQFAPK